MSGVRIDPDLLEAVASRLDLRLPNREAVESVIYELSQHHDVEHADEDPVPTFECVVDSATGVGKTFILAGLLEYLTADRAVRDFAVITPGKTILNKTIDNFTRGHPKSLLDRMEVDPVVITADNFASPATRAAMDDDTKVKAYIFTVQSLLKPRSKTDRRTHEFQEGLGAAFYQHLEESPDLVVFADEHHTYFGKAFSEAVRDLKPMALVGLTATPHPKTPEEQIVYRYPLAAAIADQWVKTPVIVGRKDDRADAATQLADGITLLRAKEAAATDYAVDHGVQPIHPLMLVIAQDIADAEEYERVLTSEAFDGGRWADHVLRVDSSQPDQALALLDSVEDPQSQVRIIIAVGMLKEGWDVKNVYVIASMRASVSEILTEQTLGRGMRLPWGEYTGIEMLDTLEVLAHERYEQLLKRANVLNESFIDHRTRAVLKRNAQGDLVSTTETSEAGINLTTEPDLATAEDGATAAQGTAKVADIESRTHAAEAGFGVRQTYLPRDESPPLKIPRLEMSSVVSQFSLADITDYEAFRKLGEQVASNPEEQLRRTTVSARVITGPDGLRRTELVTSPAVDDIDSPAQLIPLEEARSSLEDAVLSSDVVPARNPQRERQALQPILDAFIDGLGGDTERILSAFRERAAARLVRTVTEESRRFAAAPKYDHVVKHEQLGGPRETTRTVSKDRTGRFSKAAAYNGWLRSIYPAEWFDSSPERDVANAIDSNKDVKGWTRLHARDLPILWRSDNRTYNADFVVIEDDETHWVIEVKSDRDMTRDEVRQKREAARRWVNYVNSDDSTDVAWRYLLISETDIQEAKGSWEALKSLGI